MGAATQTGRATSDPADRKQVVERDRGDTERKAAPLRKADDAIEVDTTGMTVEEVVDRLAGEVEKRRRKLGKG